MKTLLTLAACVLLASPLDAETKMGEGTRPGFVYLQEMYGDSKTDIYLNPAQIAVVTLQDIGGGKFEVYVVTTAAAPGAGAGAMRYTIEFPEKAQAVGCVNTILQIMKQAASRGTN
jgi:hypothetical protein